MTYVQEIQKTVDEARHEMRERATHLGRNLRELATECPYAVVGGVDLALERTRAAWRSAGDLPRALQRGVRDAPERLREGIDEMGSRGRRIVRRMRRTSNSGGRSRAVRRTARSTTRDAAEPAVDTRPYEERTLDELYELATERDLRGRSEMNKDELIAALRAER